MARSGAGLVPVLLRIDAVEAAPTVVDIAGRAPAVAADLRAPLPDVAHAVLAEAVDDIAISLIQSVAHHLVGLLQPLQPVAGRHIAVGAPVVFQVVDAPARV